MKNIDRKIRDLLIHKIPEELALGFLRYESLRRLNARQYTELCQTNLKGDKKFDELVDELVIKDAENY